MPKYTLTKKPTWRGSYFRVHLYTPKDTMAKKHFLHKWFAIKNKLTTLLLPICAISTAFLSL